VMSRIEGTNHSISLSKTGLQQNQQGRPLLLI
jgi:hypothetical protein